MVTFFSQCGYECPEFCNPFDIYGTAVRLGHTGLCCRGAQPHCDLPQWTTPLWTRAAARGRRLPSAACGPSPRPTRAPTRTRACWQKPSRAAGGQTSRPSPLRTKSRPAAPPSFTFCSGTTAADSTIKAHLNLHLLNKTKQKVALHPKSTFSFAILPLKSILFFTFLFYLRFTRPSGVRAETCPGTGWEW